MTDDLLLELYLENNSAVAHFFACTSCGMGNVLRDGDYCRACATTWRLPQPQISDNEYIIVEDGSIDAAAESSELPVKYLVAKYRKANLKRSHYVLFFARGVWDEIEVNTKFHLPTVMRNLFEALGDV